MVGLDLFVHNGKRYFTVDIKSAMIGHKLGEFCQTKLTGRGTRRKRKIVRLKKSSNLKKKSSNLKKKSSNLKKSPQVVYVKPKTKGKKG